MGGKKMFAQQLRQVMKERGMTQTELSVKTGISKSGISQYLSGVHKPGMKALAAIADALEVPEEYLVGQNNQTYCKVKSAFNIPVKTAAMLMGKSIQYVRIGLQRGTLPIGYAVKTSAKKYTYYISPKLFFDVTGIDVTENKETA